MSRFFQTIFMIFALLLLCGRYSIALANSFEEMPLFERFIPWFETVPEGKKTTALAILTKAHARILDLRTKLHQKIAALNNLRYDKTSSPDALPQLGREMQNIRIQLTQELEKLTQELTEQVGSAPDCNPLCHMHSPLHEKNETISPIAKDTD